MKRSLFTQTLLKQTFLAVPAAALMLGAAQAGTTVGLNFQAWYYDSGANPQTVGFGAGYQTTGFPVTGRAFGVPTADWFSTDPLNCQAAISDFATFNLTNTTFAGLTATLTAPNAWQSGIGEQVSGWHPETVAPGDNEVTWGYLDSNASQSPAVAISGLAARFTHGYVIQTIAAQKDTGTFNDVDITDGVTTNTVSYFAYFVSGTASDGVYSGNGTVGLSGPSSVFTNDAININCQAQTSPNRSTLAGFIITDQPIVSRDPQNGVYVQGNPFTLTSIAAGLPPLAYQWRTNGVPIPGATSASYTNASATAAAAGAYDIVVTNLYGSATSAVATVTIVVAHPAQTVTWDADTVTGGAQDGNGTWNYTPAHWWTGSREDTWWINDTAVFGAGGTGPYTVTLGASMTANAVTFSGGNYTITNSAGESLTLQGAATVTAAGNGVINVPFSTGTNALLKAGAGAVTLSGPVTCGSAFVSAGTLEILAKTGDSPYVVTNGATLKIGYDTGGGYANTGLTLYGDGAAATTGWYIKGGNTYNVSGTPTIVGAPTTIRQYGTGLAFIGIFDINSTGLYCTAPASGSVIDANVQLVTSGYGMAMQVDAGAHTATGDLIVNSPLNIDAHNGLYGLVKRGSGSVRLNATATATNCALDVRAGSAICGANDCIGTNATLKVALGAACDIGLTSQTISNAFLSGTLHLNINKGGVPASGTLNGPVNYGGTLAVDNLGASLVLGDTFTLFPVPGSGDFTNLTLPAVSNGLAWTNKVAVDGTIQVITGSVPPSITSDLSGTTNSVYPGGRFTFTISATGDPTLRYQWWKNGTTVVGTDSPTLSLTSVTTADDGNYFVIVTNNFGSARSLTNHLAVVTPTGAAALAAFAGPVAYWPLGEVDGTTAFDLLNGHNATYLGNYSLNIDTNTVTGMNAPYFDGGSARALTSYSADLNPAVFTVEAWVDPGANGVANKCVLSCGQFGSPRSGWLIYQQATGWNFRTYMGVSTTVAANVNGTNVPTAGTWTHLLATWDGTTATLYVNGVPDGSQVPTTSPNYLPGASGGFCVAARADNNFWWAGLVSGVAFYNRVLTPAEIQSHAANIPAIFAAPSGASVILAWPYGTLQAAPEATGTYTNVPGAKSPQSVTPAGARGFFRLSN